LGPLAKGNKEPLPRGSLFFVLTVTDSGTKVEREELTRTVALPAPGGAKRFERSVPARPGFIIADVKFGPKNSAVSNLQAVVAEDRRFVKVLGEWSSGAEVGIRLVTFSDAKLEADAFPILKGEGTASKVANAAALSLTLVEEKRTAVELPAQTVPAESGGGWGWWGHDEAPLPPRPSGVEGLQRRVDLEVRSAGEDGRSYLVLSAPNVRFPWSGQVPMGRCALGLWAEQVGDRVHFKWNWLFP
jgi:hypothetical protein